MNKRFHRLSAMMAVMLLSLVPLAAAAGGQDGWTLDPARSKIAFGSVKKDRIGESHHFREISGAVSADGTARITINLASIETRIGIRNERIIKHVFGGAASATMSAKLDMDRLQALPVGGTDVVGVEATLSFLGRDIPIEADMFVAHLSGNEVLVVTDRMIWLSTKDLGIDAGIDKLKELVKLPSITRAVPVVACLVFTR